MKRPIYFFMIFLLLICSALHSQEEHELEVLGEKFPMSFDIKRGVVVIEGEILQKLPAYNLPQLLGLIANMNFVSRGLFQADPQIMGFNQEQIVVMINGIPMNNAQTGHHNFSLPVDIDQISRVEILRGGYSSLSGFSGAGGLINIITTGRNRIKLSLSSFDTTEASLNVNFENFYLSAGRVSTDGYLDGTDGNKT